MIVSDAGVREVSRGSLHTATAPTNQTKLPVTLLGEYLLWASTHQVHPIRAVLAWPSVSKPPKRSTARKLRSGCSGMSSFAGTSRQLVAYMR